MVLGVRGWRGVRGKGGRDERVLGFNNKGGLKATGGQ